MMRVTLWYRSGRAGDQIRAELEGKGYAVDRVWSSDPEPSVSNDRHFTRGYGDIYERFLATPIRAAQK